MKGKRQAAKLQARRKAYDQAGYRPGSGYRRPGSLNAKKQA